VSNKIKQGLLFPNHGSDPRFLAEIALEAEKAGWDGFFIWDNLVALDPTIGLAAIAYATSKIKIGSMVFNVGRRRPWKLGRELVAIDHLSQGRLIIGAGLGDEGAYTTYGETGGLKPRAEKLDEGLEILSGLLSGEEFEYTGKHYQIKKTQFRDKPVQESHVPIWIGGLWPNKGPFRRAAKYDGIMPHTVRSTTLGEQLTHEEVKDIMRYIESHRKGSMDDFTLAMLSSTPPEEDQAREIISPFIELGAKWWVESVFEWQIPMEDAIERVKAGPTKF
jgi:alkanesulfonate monooxygenase SsuD/methylene tetrahydromethanopterin reductase-like flavin-dependent oxidoreductase (luciferase family)